MTPRRKKLVDGIPVTSAGASVALRDLGLERALDRIDRTRDEVGLLADGRHSANFEGFLDVLVVGGSAGLHEVDGTDLAADGQTLLSADCCPADLGQGSRGGLVCPEVAHAAAKDHRSIRPMSSNVADPLVLDVVERDGVGDLVADEEHVGFLVGERANRVVSRGT